MHGDIVGWRGWSAATHILQSIAFLSRLEQSNYNPSLGRAVEPCFSYASPVLFSWCHYVAAVFPIYPTTERERERDTYKFYIMFVSA